MYLCICKCQYMYRNWPTEPCNGKRMVSMRPCMAKHLGMWTTLSTFIPTHLCVPEPCAKLCVCAYLQICHEAHARMRTHIHSNMQLCVYIHMTPYTCIHCTFDVQFPRQCHKDPQIANGSEKYKHNLDANTSETILSKVKWRTCVDISRNQKHVFIPQARSKCWWKLPLIYFAPAKCKYLLYKTLWLKLYATLIGMGSHIPTPRRNKLEHRVLKFEMMRMIDPEEHLRFVSCLPPLHLQPATTDFTK
jgi:hypothetical protein